MSPIVKQKGEKFTIPGKYLLLIFTLICLVLMMITYGTTVFDKAMSGAAGAVVVPFEKGVARIGEWLGNRKEEFRTVEDLLEENAELKAQVDQLTEENTILNQEKYELNQLRSLMQLSDEYDSYNKVGARVIAGDSDNWFTSFIIDKGSNDGLDVDMNVIAGGGLVGIITKVEPNWSRVKCIISDGCNVSGQILSTGDTLIVSGDLELMETGHIRFSRLSETAQEASVGDKIVTSQISDKYLPGLLIGYVNSIDWDNNNLTKSGELTPVVDFQHLSVVLVITDRKQEIEEK